MIAVPWSDVATKLRPFIARRVSDADIDDVLQDVLLRMHRGLGDLADEQRLSGWMYQVARNAIADHGRTRARHPLAVAAAPATEAIAAEAIASDAIAADATEGPEAVDATVAAASAEDDRVAATALAACLTVFVARLPSPYREAVTLVELEGLTIREAAAMAGISISGMKSRVQRGRAQLREMLEACCAIALDSRGKVTDVVPRERAMCGAGCVTLDRR